jgi:peptidoglycan/LPS O-acetylase OafA/YrhL
MSPCKRSKRMPRCHSTARAPARIRQQDSARSAALPRWIAVLAIVLVGFVLLLGALSDPQGNLGKPGVGGYLFIAALIMLAAGVAFGDRKRRPALRRSAFRLRKRDSWV